MNEIILLKLGELVLKGLNRRTFEDRLIANAKRRLRPHGDFKVYTKQSTMYVEPKDDGCDLDGAWEAMTKLFGVVGLSRARACEKDKDAMLQTAIDDLGDKLAAAHTLTVGGTALLTLLMNCPSWLVASDRWSRTSSRHRLKSICFRH